MGFLDTVIDSLPSASGLIMVSKKGMAPYGQVNTVNAFKEVLFVIFLLGDKCIIHIPEPNFFGGVGGCA